MDELELLFKECSDTISEVKSNQKTLDQKIKDLEKQFKNLEKLSKKTMTTKTKKTEKIEDQVVPKKSEGKK